VTDRLERLWATWRSDYVADPARRADGETDCVLCGVLDLRHEHPDELIAIGETAAVVVNAYPYTSGHVMVLPYRHVARLADLELEERRELFDLLDATVAAVEATYGPDGVNFGANLGRGAGAGIPGHLHVHVLPRWVGDTNFMTTISGVRVVPESLADTRDRLRAALEEPRE